MDNFKTKFDLLCDEFLSKGNSQNQLNIILTKDVVKKKKSRCSPFYCYVAAIFLLFLAGYCYQETMDDITVIKLVMPYVYPVLRFVRIVSLPLSTRIDMTDIFNINAWIHPSAYYDGDCLLRNPYYDRTPNCLSCQGVIEFSERRGMPSSYDDVIKTDDYISPQIYKNSTTPVSLDEFLDTCTKYLDILNTGIHAINSTHFNDFVHFGDALKNSRLQFLQDKLFRMQWKTELIGPARIFRKLFKRPTFVDISHEIHVDKLILIDGSESGPSEINLSGSASALYYIQASGSRRITLVPNPACSHCSNIEATVSPGDIVHIEYNDDWRLVTHRVTTATYSLAFVQTYNTS